jgi:hypothetical protein
LISTHNQIIQTITVAAYDYSGFSVSSAGDVNGDGLDDLIVGAKGGDLNNITNVGKSYVVLHCCWFYQTQHKIYLQ